MDRRDVMRAFAWVAGVPLALAAAVLLVLLLLNWKDQPPSAEARRLEAMLDTRPSVDDAANGYIHALGLAAERGSDPLAVGRARSDYIATFSAPPGSTDSGVVPGRNEDYRSARSPEVAALAAACNEAASCQDALGRQRDVADQWIASEQWLLDRYRRMLATEGWREAIPRHVNTQLPAWHTALDGQQLHLVTVLARAREGDAASVRDLLEVDHAFWRRALASSDTLISKMIAVAAIRRNLAFGNQALRALPSGLGDAALPPSWERPLGMEERSLARPLAAEWTYITHALRSALSVEALTLDADLPAPEALARRLYKPQATANLFAARLLRQGEVSELPYPELAAELDGPARPADGTRRIFRLYNPIGHIIDSISMPAYDAYIARAADLEGQRRTTMLVAELRANGTRIEDVADAVHSIPSDAGEAGGTLEWDAAAGAVVFHGLESGERGRFAVLY